VDVFGLGPSIILMLHFTIGDSLDHSIIEKELENIILKNRISELEDPLSPRPLFVEPLSIIVPKTIPQGTPCISSKVKKNAKLLRGIRMYVANNINKCLNTILDGR